MIILMHLAGTGVFMDSRHANSSDRTVRTYLPARHTLHKPLLPVAPTVPPGSTAGRFNLNLKSADLEVSV
jgi:hypothetical protein